MKIKNILFHVLSWSLFVIIMVASIAVNALILDYIVLGLIVTGSGFLVMLLSWLLALMVTFGLVFLLDEIIFLLEVYLKDKE